MASYEELEVTAALRQRARLVFAEFEDVIREMSRGMDLDQQLELTLPLVTFRKMLSGDEAPPASIEVPANVRRLVAYGKKGPAFGEGQVETVIGKAGLRSGAMDLPKDGA